MSLLFFSDLGFKHLLLLTVRITLLKLLLLCLDEVLFAFFKLCQIFLLKYVTCGGINSASAFFGLSVL